MQNLKISYKKQAQKSKR